MLDIRQMPTRARDVKFAARLGIQGPEMQFEWSFMLITYHLIGLPGINEVIAQ